MQSYSSLSGIVSLLPSIFLPQPNTSWRDPDRDLTFNPCGALQLPGSPVLSRFPHPSRPDRFIICDSKAQVGHDLVGLASLVSVTPR